MISNFYGLGPWRACSVNQTVNLETNPGAWNHNFGLVFLDNPIGTGFSIASSTDEIPRDEQGVAHHLFVAIKSFIRLDPTFKSRPIYITGYSYAGKFVPAIGYYMLKKNPRLPESEGVNLAGVAIGNGVTDPVVQVTTYAANAYFTGLIDEEQKTQLEKAQIKVVKLVNSKNWIEANNARDPLLDMLQNMTGLTSFLNMRRKTQYETDLVIRLLSRVEAKRVLGVNASFVWEQCNATVNAGFKADVMKSVKYMMDFLVKESKVLLYQGQLDLQDGVVSVEVWMKKLKWEGIKGFLAAERKVWRVDGEPAGYVQKWEGQTHAALDAGHLVPTDQAVHSQAMIEDCVIPSKKKKKKNKKDWVMGRGLFARKEDEK